MLLKAGVRRILPILCFSISIGMMGCGNSEYPAISSFSPASGEVGTSVTITGTNLDATADNNTVMFNGTAASVSSATSTSVVSIVPSGTRSGVVTVTTNSQSASSSAIFTEN